MRSNDEGDRVDEESLGVAMCGIAGIAYTRERPVAPELVDLLTEPIKHRGPDDHGEYFGRGAALGHRRLSIIDVSASGRQPLANEDGRVQVVVNGEIYNFMELREELIAKGHRFHSYSDSEVVVHLYEEYGEDCVERLAGMFALAIWDDRDRTLILCRDRIGKKPLKYALTSDGIVFASELKSILASGLVSREVRPFDIDHYLNLGYVPSPHTGFEAIRKLGPGERLIWRDGEASISRYWEIDFSKKRIMTPDDWKAEVRSTVTAAVERRMISDVPLGAFLSGGIDSSIVVACMARLSDQPIETFSIGFEHETFNELPHAAAIARLHGTNHHEFMVGADEVDLLPTLAKLYEEPFADPSALPTYYLARETRRFVTVALSGDGGDESFAGYNRYSRFLRLRERGSFLFGTLPRALHIDPGRLSRLLPPRFARGLDVMTGIAGADLGAAYQMVVRHFSEQEKVDLYRSGMKQAMCESGDSPMRRWMSRPNAGSDLIDQMCYADIEGYLPGQVLAKVDIASMAHALEVRSPLLDQEVLELAASAPPDIRLRGGELKWLLKAAFSDDLPGEIFSRPKAGFGIPLQEWFRGPWLAFAREMLTSEETRLSAYMERDALERILAHHVERRASMGFQLWNLLMLELWHREVVEASAASFSCRS
jgi:asparagine synthase (glutamine-hydrolysing)